MKHSLEEVFGVVSGEREYQLQRWPGHKHSVGAYLSYMWHHLRVVNEYDSTLDCSDPEQLLVVMDQIRKLAALGVACMEENGIIPRGADFREGPVSREIVLLAIAFERRHQATIWPEYEEGSETSEEVTMIRRYLRKADEAWTDTDGDAQALEVIRKIVTIAVRCMQNNGAPERL